MNERVVSLSRLVKTKLQLYKKLVKQKNEQPFHYAQIEILYIFFARNQPCDVKLDSGTTVE